MGITGKVRLSHPTILPPPGEWFDFELESATDPPAPPPPPGPLPPPPEPPPIGGDAIDLARAIQHDGQAFTHFPVTTRLTTLQFRRDGVHVAFSKKDGPDRWPDVTPPGWAGPLQYSLGMAMFVEGAWHVAAPVEFWHTLEASGGNVGDPGPCANGILGQVHGNWFYDARWGPLQRQPAPGERVGWFVVAGSVRNSAIAVQERSNVVVVPFPTIDGATFSF